MTSKTLLSAAVIAVLLALTTGTPPAHAEAAAKVDPRGDAPARLDITTLTYRNAPQKVAVHLVVPDLVRGGSAALGIAQAEPQEYVYFEAIVRVTPSGSLRKRLVRYTESGTREVPCALKANWNAGANYIDISVPRPCLQGRVSGALYLAASTGGGKDYAPPANHLLQG